MVASQQEKVLGVLDLVRKQQANGLEALLASVDVVTQKEIVRLGREAAVLEEAQQVKVLPVEIACAAHRRAQPRDSGAPSEAPSRSLQQQLAGGGRALCRSTAWLPRQVGGSTGLGGAPQILIGASSSSSTGWLMKTSRALVQSPRISASVRLTCLPGRLPRTSSSLVMTSSTSEAAEAAPDDEDAIGVQQLRHPEGTGPPSGPVPRPASSRRRVPARREARRPCGRAWSGRVR